MSEVIDAKDMYTVLSEAKKEIWKRREDKNLQKRIIDYLGGEIPDPFKKNPRAVLSRSVITPNNEFFYFLDMAKESKLEPIGLEGLNDKYCTKNHDKVSLGKLSFLKNKNRNKMVRMECEKTNLRIVDMAKWDGKKICDVKTFWGENLADFHHRLLDLHDSKVEIFDDFEWFSKNGRRNGPDQYYENFLALFLCHGILFENFHAKGKEASFTDSIIVKNIRNIEKEFGLKPLIVPLVPIEDENWLYYWNSYSEK